MTKNQLMKGLRAYINKAGITQEEAAQKFGIPYRTFQANLLGESFPRASGIKYMERRLKELMEEIK